MRGGNSLLRFIKSPEFRKIFAITIVLVVFFLLIPRAIHRVPIPSHHILQVASPELEDMFVPFPFPEELKAQVDFWKKIFTEYSTTQVVIHDDWYVNVVYEVIDIGEFKSEKDGWDAVKKAQEKYTLLLDNLSKKWETPQQMTKEERCIYNLFQDISELPRFKKKDAKNRVRTQLGQADRFKEGLIRAGSYLDAMKQLLVENDLPEKLVYLPLIESAFNPFAKSYVGASGIWQFMRGTAKQYALTINSLVDERKDPLLASRAAAQLLADNYEALQSWPLAITAYNHGLQGIKKAVEKLGSTDIVDLITKYDGPRFGFSSRNFYAEFLAALDVCLRHTEYFGEIDFNEPLEITQVKLPHHISVNALEKYSLLTEDRIKQLNPALHPEVFRRGNFIPKGYQLNILAQDKEAFERQYASIPQSLKYQYLPVKATHRVRKGETLSSIAKRYKITVKAIASLNGIKNTRMIRIGQVLKIPGGYVAVAQKSGSQSQAVQGENTLVVQQGQTLVAIAKMYKTSVEAIAKLNSIQNPRKLRVGQVLELPPNSVAQSQPVASRTQDQSVAQGENTHVVSQGQTLAAIAKQYNTTVEAIAQLNSIQNPRTLKIGQELEIPGKSARDQTVTSASENQVAIQEKITHVVQQGQTLAAIAKQYNTTVEAIAQLNAIQNPRTLKVGQELEIPAEFALDLKIASHSPDQAAMQKRITHVVKKGQTLFTIARMYNTSAKAIAEKNEIKDPRKIKAGQILEIPRG